MANNKTPFSLIISCFLDKITDDMYMEMTEAETEELAETLLIQAIHWFEFPRKQLEGNYEAQCEGEASTYCGVESDGIEVPLYIRYGGQFNVDLTTEEIDILATYMVVEWIGYQLADVKNTRMLQSGDDFKFTSQANHMSKLTALRKHQMDTGFHLQRLYKRRRITEDGKVESTMDTLMSSSVRGAGWI